MNPRFPTSRPGIVWGVGISALLHALLIFGYRLGAPAAPVDLPPPKTMTVWLQPSKPPVPLPAVAAIAPPPKQTTQPKQPRPRKTEPERELARSAEPTPTTAPAPAPAQAITMREPVSNAADPLRAQPEQSPKTFDMNAALKTARKVANEKDPARAHLPVAQLDDHPLYPEDNTTELARKMDGAKRGDCKNTPGGLLAPLVWLLDKKDSGCKW